MLAPWIRKIALSAVLAMFLMASPVGAQSPIIAPAPQIIQAEPFIHDEIVIESQSGPSHIFKIELALTPRQQAKGMMGRTFMQDDTGMLFVFNSIAIRSFWMKNTLIPLDMIFVARDGTINQVHDSAVPHNLTPVKSDAPAYAVLELRGGVSAELGIKKGDKINHAFFKHIDSK